MERISMGRPRKNPEVVEDTLEESEGLLRALQQYTDDDEFIMEILALTIIPPRMAKANPTKYVDFALWYTAAIKKDIRAIQYWLDAHSKDVYGKSVAVDVDENLKADILKELAARLPD